VEVIIKENYEEMSQSAAEIIADLVKSKPDCVLGFCAGATPIGTYRELIRLQREGVDFSAVKAFNADEYLGLGIELSKPYAKDRSFARFMHEELFKQVNIKKENIKILDGLAKEPGKYCAWYEEEIKRAGGIDLQILGIGHNGHLAFNEPGSSLSSRTRIQALTDETLEDNFKSFFKKAGIKREKMPRFALTLGIGTILEMKHLLLLVNGKKKAKVVAEALEGPITSRIPASALQLHSGRVTVVLDRGAASKLKNIEC
jgi:glucosamine-6-phosphate deaminase